LLEKPAPTPGIQKTLLLTVKQVAQQLGMSTASVYGLCADGRLPHIRILNAIRVAPADVAAFVASCRDGRSRPIG
jgi:excisionase family DNA binding protein